MLREVNFFLSICFLSSKTWKENVTTDYVINHKPFCFNYHNFNHELFNLFLLNFSQMKNLIYYKLLSSQWELTVQYCRNGDYFEREVPAQLLSGNVNRPCLTGRWIINMSVQICFWILQYKQQILCIFLIVKMFRRKYFSQA